MNARADVWVDTLDGAAVTLGLFVGAALTFLYVWIER